MRRGAPRAAALLLALSAAAATRAVAVRDLPPDYDELVYLPAAFRYAERLAPGRLGELPAVRDNPEHPALVKLLFGAELRRSGAAEPDWEALRVGRPLPDAARPAFTGPRALSAAAGALQVLVAGLASPPGALWLAFDTYHVKYSAEAMLEGVAGLFAALAVILAERALRPRAPGGPAPAHAGPLLAAAAALGLAAASKYPYALVVGAALAPFLVARLGRRPALLAAFAAVALAAFLAADPPLWADPVGRLRDSLAFHWRYPASEHVRQAALPWWQPLYWLTHAAPARWHPGVFPVAVLDALLLPAAALGAPAAARRRPLWLAWAVAGLAFVLAWPTRWPQYSLLARTPLAVCAGLGLAAGWERLRRARRGARAGPRPA